MLHPVLIALCWYGLGFGSFLLMSLAIHRRSVEPDKRGINTGLTVLVTVLMGVLAVITATLYR